MQAGLELLHAPDWLEFKLPDQHVCLLTNDGSLSTIALAQILVDHGWSVVVLSFPGQSLAQSLPANIPHFTLSDWSEICLKQQLEEIQQKGVIAAFIHLHPVFEPCEHPLQNESEKLVLKQVFLLAKYCKKPLMEASGHFVTVTRLDGEFGLRSASQVIGGGLAGLTKTMNLEAHSVFCRTIDIDPNWQPAQVAHAVLSELHDPNRRLVEVGYRDRGRVALVGQPLKSSRPNSALNSSSVILVSGGGKGITAQCVLKLAEVVPCKFILLGRSERIEEPSWAANCEDERELRQKAITALSAQGQKPTPAIIQQLIQAIRSQREITKTLRALEQIGAQVEYVSADLQDATDLKQQLAPIVQQFGNITGIIHGAGTLADKLIENKTEQDFERVYTTKIDGLNSLLSAVEVEQLECFVLFSSAAGFYGNIGQSDYAIANEILNKFAHRFHRQFPQCRVISFNWGPWDSGMVTPELKKIFAERQIDVIPSTIGTQVFVNQILASDAVQPLVGSALATPIATPCLNAQPVRIRRCLTLAANPFLQDHVIGQHVVLPTVCSAAWFANLCEQRYPGYHFFSCDQQKVFKGIVFDQTLASEYILELQELFQQSNELVIRATLWSKANSGKPRFHYGATITLLKVRPEIPVYTLFNTRQDLAARSPYTDGTLFHGARFQGIRRVLNLTQDKLTMECVLPEVEASERGQFPAQAVDAIALDVQYQSLLIWVRQFYQAGSLPLSCDRGEYYRPIPTDEAFYVSMDVRSHSATKLVADVHTHDGQGLVYCRVFGAEVTISPQLNVLFSASAKV